MKKTRSEVVAPVILTETYRQNVANESRLGRKGYTIPKNALTKEDLDFLCKDLMLKPVMMGPSYGQEKEAAFPVYRENANKIYVPRFYGMDRYGAPGKSEVGPGSAIDLVFQKPLRDYQEKIIGVYVDHVLNRGKRDERNERNEGNGNGGILEVPCGRGKCLGKDTPILMYDGTIKTVQNVEVGDQIMGDDSTPRNVLSLARGRETMYKIREVGSSEHYIANKSHILSLIHSETKKKLDLTIDDYLSNPNKDRLFGYRMPIQFEDTSPYDDIDFYEYGYACDMRELDIGVIRASRICRMELLAGIVDRIGSVEKLDFQIHIPWFVKENLTQFVVYLVRSLGFAIKIQDNDHNYRRETEINLFNTLYVNMSEIPLRLKINCYSGEIPLSTLEYPIQATRLEIGDYYGFEIDGNRRFVLGDFTVTHNTVMALKIISILKQKTLIIVHKEFLMNQWIERIAEFLPGARVGKIQAQVFDVANKDIVIGMIQTMYDKDFPQEAMSTFGLTIIDEVHRIGSEQFSKALLKTVTHYMLGISATVDRKDGLTRILHMFIGDKIYSEAREDTDEVTVRAIQYKTDDAEFLEPELDYRGQPKFSTMISKLCAYNRRSDFVVRVLGDLVEENPDSQIMILAHNRSLLTYLHDAIEYRKIAASGFYVGGMKQTELQATESKQIVLATYAMAAEALDIKTLSTLVMVTPKTDIIQSVGRILRVKHDNPLVIDIVDPHDIFQNQWVKRRQYYKRCNYRIVQTDSSRYAGFQDMEDWKLVFEPKVNSYSKCKKIIPHATNDEDGDGAMKCLINVEGLGF
jgi:superfamily II DNA or RNA helicase